MGQPGAFVIDQFLHPLKELLMHTLYIIICIDVAATFSALFSEGCFHSVQIC